MYFFNMKINLIFAAFALFVVASCGKKAEKPEIINTFILSDKMYQSTKLDTAKDNSILNELNFYGKISADNNNLIEIYPIVGGNVKQVYVELGDYVQKGQLLATIRSTEVAGYEKDLEDAKNELIVATNNLKVVRDLYQGHLNTDLDVQEAKSRMEKAKSQLQRISETYNIYDMKPGAIYEIRSPLSGFIIQKNINQNMLLRSDRTDNIFDIAKIDEVWAIANINESDINNVKLGLPAEVTTLSTQGRIFNGVVDKIFNIVDPETKSMKVRIKLNNSEYLLKPEMRAEIKLHWADNSSMLCIPQSAVIFDKGKSFVMVFHSKANIETRQVTIFRQVAGKAFISEGLKPGEVVMTTNQLLVYDALND